MLTLETRILHVALLYAMRRQDEMLAQVSSHVPGVRTLLVVQVINHAASEHRSILSEHLREESSILLRLRDESLIEF